MPDRCRSWRTYAKAGTADMAASAVLRNNVIVGSVNANKRSGTGQDKPWQRRPNMAGKTHHTIEKPENFMNALERKPDDIKVVIQFSEI